MRGPRALVLLMLLAVPGCGGGSGRAADDRPAPPPAPASATPSSADPLRWVQKDLRRYVAWAPSGMDDHACFGAFTCAARLVGDSAWSVVCRDGARRVRFGRAD
jgi:hypothetical protein